MRTFWQKCRSPCDWNKSKTTLVVSNLVHRWVTAGFHGLNLTLNSGFLAGLHVRTNRNMLLQAQMFGFLQQDAENINHSGYLATISPTPFAKSKEHNYRYLFFIFIPPFAADMIWQINRQRTGPTHVKVPTAERRGDRGRRNGTRMEKEEPTACSDWIGAILRAVLLRMHHLCAGTLQQLRLFNRGAVSGDWVRIWREFSCFNSWIQSDHFNNP